MKDRIKQHTILILLAPHGGWVQLTERERRFRRSVAFALLWVAEGAFSTYIGFDRISRHDSYDAQGAWLFAIVSFSLAASFTLAALHSRPKAKLGDDPGPNEVDVCTIQR